MVEAMLRHELDARQVSAIVTSAGTVSAGQPASDEVLELLKARGLDGAAHRSAVLDRVAITDADLVIGMAREHVRAVSMEVPGAFARTFTLKELVRRGTQAGPRREDEALADWLARVGVDREPRRLLGSSPDDDVADPVGRRFKVFKRMAVELDDLVPAAVALAYPPG